LILLCRASFKLRRSFTSLAALVCLMVGSAMACASCSGIVGKAGGGSSGTPAGAYTLTITGTSSAQTESAKLTLIVN
jgi:hypothetical protein